MAFGFSVEREIFGQKNIFERVDANYAADIDCIICDVVSRFNIACTNFLLCSSVEVTESVPCFVSIYTHITMDRFSSCLTCIAFEIALVLSYIHISSFPHLVLRFTDMSTMQKYTSKHCVMEKIKIK